MYKWVEDFFKDVPKSTKDSWSMVNAPIATDLGVITITFKEYTTSIEFVGDFFDQEIGLNPSGKGLKMTMRTEFAGKTIVWNIVSDFTTLKLKQVK